MGRRRGRIAAALALSCLAGAAGAAQTPAPQIPVGVPFKVAQERLARAGIVPARIVRMGAFCGGEQMACGPLPHIVCGNWYDYCRYLFVRRSDNIFLFVDTRADDFYEIRPASRAALREITRARVTGPASLGAAAAAAVVAAAAAAALASA